VDSPFPRTSSSIEIPLMRVDREVGIASGAPFLRLEMNVGALSRSSNSVERDNEVAIVGKIQRNQIKVAKQITNK
jgi:hypothetical protein